MRVCLLLFFFVVILHAVVFLSYVSEYFVCLFDSTGRAVLPQLLRDTCSLTKSPHFPTPIYATVVTTTAAVVKSVTKAYVLVFEAVLHCVCSTVCVVGCVGC